MSKLTTAREGQRVAQAAQVLVLMAQGRNQVQACEEVGITPNIFRHWIQRGDEALRAIQEVSTQIRKKQMVDIIEAQDEILGLLILDASADETKPGERLAIFKHLSEYYDRLNEEFNSALKTEDSAKDFLERKRVELSQAKSRMLPSTTINVKAQEDGSIDIMAFRKGEIIDGHIVTRGEPEEEE